MKKIKYLFLVPIVFIFIFYLYISFYLYFSEVHSQITVQDSNIINSKEDHEFTLIDSGLESLHRRIKAIESAQKSIELEYFIYNLDLAAQIITLKLVEAARRGVEVSILVDYSAPVFVLGPKYVQFLKQQQINVKYYNTTSLYRFIDVQHRTHRKFLIIDGEKVITGGRNIANEYFDLSKTYNFLDSDVEIKGPIVSAIRKSFFSYWNHSYASTPEKTSEEITLDFVSFEIINSVLDSIKENSFNSKTNICADIDFVTDSPGVDIQNRKIWPYLVNKLKKINKNITAESPYFILRPDGFNLISDLSKKKISQQYLTNSLYSTDAFYTVSTIIPYLSDLKSLKKFDLLIYNGSKPKKLYKSSIMTSRRWGIHAKRAVLDYKHTLIGTYNLDPRSANLNSEVLISCNNNTKIAQAMLDSMKKRSNSSWNLTNSYAPLFTLTREADFSETVKFFLILPLAHIFRVLL